MDSDRDFGLSPEMFPEPLIDLDEDPTDPHEAKQKAELDAVFALLEARKRALFAASPVCAVCPEPIERLEHATVFTPAGGRDVLIHADRGECFVKALHRSMVRYIGKPRRAIAMPAPLQPTPVTTLTTTHSWPKPLCEDDRVLVDLLIQRYEGVDGPFLKFEDETSVTLTIPRLRRVFKEVAS